jgi:hypothetical protein
VPGAVLTTIRARFPCEPIDETAGAPDAEFPSDAPARAAPRRPERPAGALGLPGLAVILCTLAACGGGAGEADGTTTASGAREQAPASRAEGAPRAATAAVAAASPAAASLPVAISNEQLFLWAQATYPQLFPDSPPITSVEYRPGWAMP